MRARPTAFLALSLAVVTGCAGAARRPDLPRPVPPPPASAASGGADRVLLDQIHRMALDDAASTRR